MQKIVRAGILDSLKNRNQEELTKITGLKEIKYLDYNSQNKLYKN